MKKIILKTLYHFLAFCSRIYIWRTKPTIIGITGSVGKTTCRMIVAEVLKNIQTQNAASFPGKGREFKRELSIYSSPKNYNSELGLVFSIFCIEEYSPSVKNLLKIALKIFFKALFSLKKYDVLIAEYGIDHPGDMDFLLKIAVPDIAVLTKLGSVHSENFPRGIQELWQQKWLLMLAAKQKVYFNTNDIFSQEHKELLSKQYTEIFSEEIPSELSIKHESFIQSWEYQNTHISLSILGKEEQEYVNLGLMLAGDLGIKLTKKTYDFRIDLLAGRFSVFQVGDNIFIDSTYNASPEAMTKLIDNTRVIWKELYPDYKLGYMLGDMREIGEVNIEAHKHIVTEIQDASLITTVGPEMYQHFIPELKKSSYQGDIHATLSSRDAGEYVQTYLKNNSGNKYVILFKGSQNTIFLEEALKVLLPESERSKLIRQSVSWLQKKENFFKTL